MHRIVQTFIDGLTESTMSFSLLVCRGKSVANRRQPSVGYLRGALKFLQVGAYITYH